MSITIQLTGSHGTLPNSSPVRLELEHAHKARGRVASGYGIAGRQSGLRAALRCAKQRRLLQLCIVTEFHGEDKVVEHGVETANSPFLTCVRCIVYDLFFTK